MAAAWQGLAGYRWALPRISSSLYYNLPKSQVTHLQQIQTSLARAVVKVAKRVLSLPSCALSTGSK